MSICSSCTQGVRVSEALDGHMQLENLKCAAVIVAKAFECALISAYPSDLHERRVAPGTASTGGDDQGMSAHPLTRNS